MKDLGVACEIGKIDKINFSTKVCNGKVLMQHVCKFCAKLAMVLWDLT